MITNAVRHFPILARYPKTLLMLLSITIAVLLYLHRDDELIRRLVDNLGYGGLFIFGFLAAYGFTTIPALVFLLISTGDKPFLPAYFLILAGAVIGSLVFYNLPRSSFHDEFQRLSHSLFFKKLEHFLISKAPGVIRKYLFTFLAGLFSATPLPPEISILLIKSSRDFSTRLFAFTRIFVNFAWIAALLLLSRLI